MKRIFDYFKQKPVRFPTLLLIVFALGFLAPAHPKICEKDIYTSTKDCTAHQVPVFAILWLGQFCSNYAGAIGALSGIAVAYFTFTLWRAGERQIVVTNASVSIAESALPRGHLFITILHNNFGPWLQLATEKLSATPLLTNYGTGPAILDFIHIKLAISDDIPDWQGSLNIEYHIDNVVAADAAKQIPLHEIAIWTRGKKYTTWNDIPPGDGATDERPLFVLVATLYHDIYGRSFETGYCASFDPKTNSLRPEGGREHNYQT